MKFFIGIFTSIAFLLSAAHMAIPTRLHADDLIPSKIIDKKKIDPIKVPYIDCIVSVEEEAHTLEEHVAICLDKRTWLKINSDKKGNTIL